MPWPLHFFEILYSLLQRKKKREREKKKQEKERKKRKRREKKKKELSKWYVLGPYHGLPRNCWTPPCYFLKLQGYLRGIHSSPINLEHS